jgi:hypothetical protein
VSFWPTVTFPSTFDCSHLHPFDLEFHTSPEKGQTQERYRVRVVFSCHCFTTEQKLEDDPRLEVMHAKSKKDPRSFNEARWKLSKQLPDIVRDFMNRRAFHTGKGNYVIVEVVDQNGVSCEYGIYFDLNRNSLEKRLYLDIQSAYLHDDESRNRSGQRRPIRFKFLIHSVQTGKKVRVPH